MKEKDQEVRLNELKIRELKRQLPPKVLKQLEEKERLMRQEYEAMDSKAAEEMAEI